MRHRHAGTVLLFVTLCVWLLTGFTNCGDTRNASQDSNSNQGGKAPMYADAQTAASQSLATLRALVNASNYKDLGFESPDEAANSTLGKPIPIMTVGLQQLRGYQRGSDPAALLKDFNEIHYPVAFKEQVRSAIVVRQVDGKWRAASFGDANLAKQIAQARMRTSTTPSTTPTPSASPAPAPSPTRSPSPTASPSPTPSAAGAGEGEMIVNIPALNLSFVGHRGDDGKLVLTSLVDAPAYNLSAGKTISAEELFALLAPVAQKQPDDMES